MVGVEKPALYNLAERLLDTPSQLAIYDEVKWNLVGDPSRRLRGQRHMPWITRRDYQDGNRAYTLDVFSGVSTDTNSVLVVRKDRWTSPVDPATWLIMETDLETGETFQHDIWSASVDAARQMWLEIASEGAHNQPVWYEYGQRRQAFRDKPPREQFRFTARLDEDWRTTAVEFRAGVYGDMASFEDIEALESMIVAIQQVRAVRDRDMVLARYAASALDLAA